MSSNAVAILSLLHESASVNSATRLFRTAPVLRWTIDRLCRARHVANVGVLCWEDQADAVMAIADHEEVDVLVKGPRRPIIELDRITAAQKFADGWRGGLHSTCAFDAGFYGPWVKELADKLAAERVLIVPAASAMVDPIVVDQLIERSAAKPSLEVVFSAAAPGLAGAVLNRAAIERLATERSHPGRSLHYMPERPMMDPIGSDACVNVPVSICRTTENFLLDSARRIHRFASAAHSLNGQLMGTGSEELVRRINSESPIGDLPRDITLELNTTRATSPIYWAGKTTKIDRPDFDANLGGKLFSDLGGTDDIRLTIGGVGDPLNSAALFDVIAAARSAGVHAIHVETDLASADESLAAKLAQSDVDVVSIYLPALSPVTYAAVMGADLMLVVLNNLKVFVTERARRGVGTPVVVPTFVKLAANLAEMDAWYDQWLTAVGSAAIVSPADASLELADMSPAKRKPCSRIARGISVLSDGRIVSCERDVTGRQVMGRVGQTPIGEMWTKRFGRLREDHATGAFAKHPVCAGCRAWHLAA